MKAIINFKSTGFSIIILLFGIMSLSNLASAQEATPVIYIKIQVDGLSCSFCAYGLEKNLKKVKDVKDVFISVKEGYSTFNVPKELPPSEEELKTIVKDAGFTPREITFSDKPFVEDDE